MNASKIQLLFRIRTSSRHNWGRRSHPLSRTSYTYKRVDLLGELQFNVSTLKETNVRNNLLARVRRSTKMIGGDVDSDTKTGSILTFLYTSEQTLTLHPSRILPLWLSVRYSNCNRENATVIFPTRAVSSLRICVRSSTTNTFRICNNIQEHARIYKMKCNNM